MEFSPGGGGDHHDASDPQRRKKRYHRHTANQIQRLESMFKECAHPDEKTRNMLSRELGLHPRQIKFWFQNRRTQMKAQHERSDNCTLRADNDRIRCENIAMREALKHVICPSCGGPPVTEDSYFDEQKLRIENAHLKEELEKVSSIAAKYIGRPMSQLPPVQPIHVSSLDLSMSSFGGHHGMPGPSLDLDLLPGISLGVMPSLPFSSMSISDLDKSLMADTAASAMDVFIRLSQSNEPLWMKSAADGHDVLNIETYERAFPRPNSHLKNPSVRIEASRESGMVIMNALALVDMLIDMNKWVELFPAIVLRGRTIEVISSGMMGSHSGTLQLMYEELQVLSALVPTRQLYILRLVQQIEAGSWAIVDVSYDIPHQENQFSSSCKAQRLPSGCLIQEMPNGYSKVTWIEHWEVEDKTPVHRLYRDLIHSGLAFGAERWLSNLQRICERIARLMATGNSSRDLGGVPSPEGTRSIMKLAQRMVNYFCSSINPSSPHHWTTVSELPDYDVRATFHRSNDPGQPNGMLLSAAATVWLPVPPQTVFNFLRDERTRPQWDALNPNPVQEVAHIVNGSHPGNCIALQRALNTGKNNMLILQESCIDSSGSLVVYCPVELPSIDIAMSGQDPSSIPLLPSGFTISPDGRARANHHPSDGASTSSSVDRSSSGSLITVVFQIIVSSSPTARMNPETVNTVNNLVSDTVQQIKAALNS